MLITIKDFGKLSSVTIVIFCAVFVCALFLNYNIDLPSLKDEIQSLKATVLYEAQVSQGKVVAGASGGCLAFTTVLLLIFYIKNYIESHKMELGILKAMGYSNINVASRFWVFGLTVLTGALAGFFCASAYMPGFYELQNKDGYFPELAPEFHYGLAISLIIIPAAAFTLLSIFYALFKIKSPVMALLKDAQCLKFKRCKNDDGDTLPFLASLKKDSLRSKKIPVFFVGFSALCFSAMTQMSLSMEDLNSGSYSLLIVSIGLVLAFTTLLMSLSSVVKSNGKTIAMMKVMGYSQRECAGSVLSGYRPVSYVGFAIGTLYQYLLLKIMIDVVFADFPDVPEYNFNFKGLMVTAAAFIAAYEIIMYFYAVKIRRQPVKSVMMEGL